jgi:hypothetical protein
MQRAGIETGTRREEMGIAMCNALALLCWRGSRFFHGNFRGNDIVWLLIGVVLAVVVIWALRRRKRRRF